VLHVKSYDLTLHPQPLAWKKFPLFVCGGSLKTVQTTSDIAGIDIQPIYIYDMPQFYPERLLKKTFMSTLYDEGSTHRVTVLRKIKYHDAVNHTKFNFLFDIGHGKLDEKIAYGILCQFIEDLEDMVDNPKYAL
jgi:hypothetical protein